MQALSSMDVGRVFRPGATRSSFCPASRGHAHVDIDVVPAGAPAGHAERNRDRLAVLTAQRDDLAACLDALWSETLAGTRRFKLYRQLKMYNDPALNPAVYRNPSTP